MVIFINDKNKKEYLFRILKNSDSEMLGNFFESLSSETKLRFGPHPLTREYANFICNNENMNFQTFYFVVFDNDNIIAYFIIDLNLTVHEINRYKEHYILLEKGKDALFAPCVADKYQDCGIAGAAMEYIIDFVKDSCIRSLVLMGGVRDDNPRARHFYEKFGFINHGGYQSDVFNHDMILITK